MLGRKRGLPPQWHSGPYPGLLPLSHQEGKPKTVQRLRHTRRGKRYLTPYRRRDPHPFQHVLKRGQRLFSVPKPGPSLRLARCRKPGQSQFR